MNKLILFFFTYFAVCLPYVYGQEQTIAAAFNSDVDSVFVNHARMDYRQVRDIQVELQVTRRVPGVGVLPPSTVTELEHFTIQRSPWGLEAKSKPYYKTELDKALKNIGDIVEIHGYRITPYYAQIIAGTPQAPYPLNRISNGSYRTAEIAHTTARKARNIRRIGGVVGGGALFFGLREAFASEDSLQNELSPQIEFIDPASNP